ARARLLLAARPERPRRTGARRDAVRREPEQGQQATAAAVAHRIRPQPGLLFRGPEQGVLVRRRLRAFPRGCFGLAVAAVSADAGVPAAPSRAGTARACARDGRERAGV